MIDGKTIEIFSIMKHNRPADLQEWINYHLAIGFDKINIYDNNSTFSIKDLFSNYGNKVSVTNFDVDFIGRDDFAKCQLETGTKFYTENKGKIGWIAWIDDDEFIYIRNNKKINEILNKNISVFSFFSKHMSFAVPLINRNTTLIETFNYYSYYTPCNNQSHVKSIVNMNAFNNIEWISPHQPIIDGEKISKTFEYITLNHESYLIDNIYFFEKQSVILYHYFHQSWEDWKFKIYRNRKNEIGKTPYKIEDINTYSDEIREKYITLDNSMIKRKAVLGI